MNRVDPARLAERVWYGHSLLGALLAPTGWLFAAAAGLRRLAYRRGWLAVQRMPVVVVVVGNITVGGTGKTPIVLWLVNELRRRALQPGVISRGYRSRVTEARLVQPGDSAADVGDEPLLISRLGAVPVCVAQDRVAAARRLLAPDIRPAVDVIIADDGLQHYRLARDVELAVVDGTRGFGNGRMLPAGPLRESIGRLREVHAVLRKLPATESMPVSTIDFSLVPGVVRNLADGREQSLSAFAGQAVRALAGIGNPSGFTHLLTAAGCRVESIPVPDHGRVDLERYLTRGAPPILMTSKDAVKYAPTPGADAWSVAVTAQISPDDGERIVAPIVALVLARGNRA